MKIAVFYHCLLSSVHRPIDPEYALMLIGTQMQALTQSGLAQAASELYVGLNGDNSDAWVLTWLLPDPAQIIVHGAQATTEIPTLNRLRDWCAQNPNDFVFYHHAKGISTPNLADGWRRRMEKHCVWGWRQCVEDLKRGIEAAGCHWLTPEGNPGVIQSPFFGGTFWWARASYINTLPALPEATWENRYKAEDWIGRGPRRPRITDYHPGWPQCG